MKNQLINQNHTENFTYRGNVKVTTMQGKKVIKMQEFHNNGTPNLFSFFADCLWNYSASTAAAYRPSKLVLFKAHTDSTTGVQETPTSDYSSTYWTEEDAVSIPIFYDKTPTGDGSLGPTDILKTTKDSTGISHTYIVGKAITLHFRVPYIYLNSGASIAKMGLFPSTVSFPAGTGIADTATEYGNMLAYYLLTDNSTTEPNFDPIEVPAAGENFTVIVDWTLSIVNA